VSYLDEMRKYLSGGFDRIYFGPYVPQIALPEIVDSEGNLIDHTITITPIETREAMSTEEFDPTPSNIPLEGLPMTHTREMRDELKKRYENLNLSSVFYRDMTDYLDRIDYSTNNARARWQAEVRQIKRDHAKLLQLNRDHQDAAIRAITGDHRRQLKSVSDLREADRRQFNESTAMLNKALADANTLADVQHKAINRLERQLEAKSGFYEEAEDHAGRLIAGAQEEETKHRLIVADYEARLDGADKIIRDQSARIKELEFKTVTLQERNNNQKKWLGDMRNANAELRKRERELREQTKLVSNEHVDHIKLHDKFKTEGSVFWGVEQPTPAPGMVQIMGEGGVTYWDYPKGEPEKATASAPADDSYLRQLALQLAAAPGKETWPQSGIISRAEAFLKFLKGE
jgi:hypothetical protein